MLVHEFDNSRAPMYCNRGRDVDVCSIGFAPLYTVILHGVIGGGT